MENKSGKKLRARIRRKMRVRKNVLGSDSVPRLCVYKSLRYTYAQLISDESNKVLAGISTAGIEGLVESPQSVASAKLLGGRVAQLAKEHGLERVVFDRNGYRYHGRVSAVAEGARDGGLNF